MLELLGVTWEHERGWGGLRAAAAAYGELRPEVRVTWETRSLQAFAHQTVEELVRYDLIVLDHPAIGAAVAHGALVPLDDHLDEALFREQRTSSVGRSFDSYTWEGHQWALPVDAAAQVAAYRPDLLERAGVEVPVTWDDVVHQAAAMRELDLWMAMPAIPVDAICAFLGISGAPFEGDHVVERGTGRRALTILRDVIDVGHPMSLVSNPPTVLAAMGEHDDIAYSPLAFGYVRVAREGSAPHALRFAPGPEMSGSLGGAGIAVSSDAEHVEEACAYASFVCSPDVQRGVYVQAGGQPGHRAAW
ncbi:MAG: extracellular solute-binding protein, partial [Actinomycetota bacterium]|nr:extracellular solute-binding protein [Actinomycetota bacterium]